MADIAVRRERAAQKVRELAQATIPLFREHEETKGRIAQHEGNSTRAAVADSLKTLKEQALAESGQLTQAVDDALARLGRMDPLEQAKILAAKQSLDKGRLYCRYHDEI